MNQYWIMKSRHQDEMYILPVFFAFDKQQFCHAMARLGLRPDETDAICKVGNIGWYMRKSDYPMYQAMSDRHAQEMRDAIDADTTGNGFIFDMFRQELADREYCFTNDIMDTLDALGLTEDEVNADKRLRHGLKKAMKAQGKITC